MDKVIPSYYRICSNCVLDSNTTNITFDEKGVCNFCNNFFKEKTSINFSNERKLELFELLLEKIKESGKGKQYDSIVGLSGGVDSTYVALIAKENGLNPLAVHFDNGWNTEISTNNIEQVCNKINIDLYTHVVDWEEFKDLQLSFLKAGVANAEMPTDHGIFALLHHLALKFKVNYILDGWNIASELPRDGFVDGGFAYSDLKHLKAIQKEFGNIPLKTFPQMSLIQKFWWKKFRNIQQVAILNYIDYDKSKVKEILKEKLGWKEYGGKHHENLFTKWHQTIYLPTRFKFDKRRLHLSDLILSGQISKEQALEELAMPTISIDEGKKLEEYVMKKLSLSLDEYEKILTAPPVPHSNYPSSEKFTSLYKRIKKLSPPKIFTR